jgi:hypothetical protein
MCCETVADFKYWFIILSDLKPKLIFLEIFANDVAGTKSYCCKISLQEGIQFLVLFLFVTIHITAL